MKFPYELIAAKRDGGELKANEIDLLVNEYTAGRIKDYQFAAFLMAVFINGLSEKETAALTGAMLKSGKTITISGLDRPLIDKHSTGGVGDKLSLVIAPLLAECGIAVGMISGRGLGHTGGTLDKLEAIPGMKVFHSSSAFARLLKRHHFAITGQTANIVPADRKIYALRNVTGTVESIPLIVASIMSKKLALKSDGILFDVKTGSGAFMKTRARAIKLAQTLLAVSRAHNLPARAIITQMNQPTGRMIGNFLEIVETVAVLQGGGPPDTIELAVELAAQMLLVAGQKSNLKSARRCVSAILESGQAYENLCRYVADCGGAVRALARPELVIKGIHKRIVKSPADGYLSQV
ncbi:MAG: thymidine phosphorylase, partial [candidate division Zixibacteria bacterium]|nr:thymidine phosphorylase [candidate division Zixibacteria bacterium]